MKSPVKGLPLPFTLPGQGVVTPDGVATYTTQSISLDVYHTGPARTVLRLSIGDTATVFELDAAARDHLIARLTGEAGQ